MEIQQMSRMQSSNLSMSLDKSKFAFQRPLTISQPKSNPSSFKLNVINSFNEQKCLRFYNNSIFIVKKKLAGLRRIKLK